MDQGSLSLSRSFLTNYTSKPNVFKAYTELIVDSAKAIRDSLGSKASDSQIRADVEAILKFESQLALVLHNIVTSNLKDSFFFMSPN